MNDDNYNEETNCLNSVNITSNVRAPGEYKYYYCGENNSSSDKSFLCFSTMWYTTKISEEKYLLSSCYTEYFTAFIYYCPIKSLYNIYVYKNYIDYKSENISLKPIQLIHLKPAYKSKDIIISENDSGGMPSININVKIYFGANNYILLNEIDRRILLIDFYNGNYITLFNNKEAKTQEPIYNILDTFDEDYFSDGEQKIRTYVFLNIKTQEKKMSYYNYKYRFIIIENDILDNNYFFLHRIDLDLGKGEPIGLKIAKIPKYPKKYGEDNNEEENKNQQWFFIFCFLSNKILFQFVTNYNRLSLFQTLKFMNQCYTTKIENSNDKKIIKSSTTIIGYYIKDNNNNNMKNQEYNKDIDNDDNDKEINKSQNKKTFYWMTSISLWFEKKQLAQTVKIFLNINTKRLSALILFFENGKVVSFPFNYNDSPEDIKNKITITSNEIQIDNKKAEFGPMAKIYTFEKHYFYKSNTICALSYKYLVLAIDNKIRIYDLETNQNLLKYSFYKENIASFMLFENIGFTFMMTWNKIFKIIFTPRFEKFSEKKIINESKVPINNYKSNGLLTYPIFEYKPEDIWNSYYSNLELENKEKGKIEKNIKCEICYKEAEYCCSGCGLKYYCGQEHFIYDYNQIHFFECQFVQFFRRKDIMEHDNEETRYLILYNELIKLCGRILNYIFTRISVAKDCHLYLNMLLNLITLLDNFGFNVNYSEFCSVNLFPTNDKQKPEKVLFFQECIYYYIQLQLLKCTFTSKCKLYNLTDCYLKIIKNDIIPKLTPKTNKRIIALRCDKIKKRNFLDNSFFKIFESPLFFDLKKIYYNCETIEAFDLKKIFYQENNDKYDLVENYIMKHLMVLSIIVKFKIKLHSSIDVKDIFVDITLMFDYHFRENKAAKNIVPYCYFSIAFYLVEIGKVPQTVKLLKKMVQSFSEKTDIKLKALTYYNLGILQYALGDFKIGIHNLEIAYKQIVDNSLSEKHKQRAMISLGLAYLNQPNLFKAYVLIQKLINELKKIKKSKYELRCIKLSIYLNYIIDLFEYSFITKSRIQTNKPKKDNYYYSRQLVSFVEGGTDKELVVIEQHVSEFLKVVEYIWNLKPQILQHLQTDNPPKQTNNYREEVHHEKNSSFTIEQSQMSTFMMREAGVEKEENQEEYDEDIEVKPQLFDSLTRQQQKDFKELKTAFLKRDIILRDSLGAIEKFNINYDPLYSPQFQKIIEKLKSNFLLKEIFYCFQNEKWRDELYNYSPNNVLFGLSKYLKLEKIKNVIAIEKSKCLDQIKKEKSEFNNTSKRLLLNQRTNDTLRRINIENNIYPNNTSNIFLNSSSYSLSAVNNRYKAENLNYLEFKKRFLDSLKENEKNKKKYNETNPYINLKEEYLVNLYKNVYLNNPEHDFIFRNPSLILNYIFIDISGSNENIKKEENDLILRQKSEEEYEINNNINRKNRKISNADLINFDDSPKHNKYSQKQSKKEFNNIFDKKGKFIISPILEKNQDKNINMESSSESIKTEEYSYYYLKFEENDLQIVSKEIEYIYHFVKKKKKESTLKKRIEKKKTEIYLDKYVKRKLKYNEDDEFVIDIKNRNKNKNLSLERKEKSETNLNKKTGKYFGVKLIKYEDSSDELEERNNEKIEKKIENKINKTEIKDKLEINNNNQKEEENVIEKEIATEKEKEKENSILNKSIKSITESANQNEIIKKENNNIKRKSQIQENIDLVNIKKEKKEKDNISIKYTDILNNIINNSLDSNKKNKYKNNINDDKIKLYKNNSMKQFNYKDKKGKEVQRIENLLSPRKKYKKFHKTYNNFNTKELNLPQENNKNENRKQGKNIINKNYGFKNKAKQEMELINGAIEYLQNNQNKSTKKLLNNNKISLEIIQKKYNEINENNYEYKNRNNNKLKKEEESTMSFTSNSSELIQNKNNKNNNISEENISNMFQKEMNKIMKYNKKIKNNKRKSGSAIKKNISISRNVKYDFNVNINYDNKRMKKSLTQIKFGKTENEKTTYSKNPKSNKYCSSIENQKSIYIFNNKSINNNNFKNCSESTKLNNKKEENKKFRYVLDKYVIYKNNKRNSKNLKNNNIKKRNNNENEEKKLKEKKSLVEYKDNNLDKKNNLNNGSLSNNINIESENYDSSKTLCDDLGNNIDIKDLINLPFYITPKYSNNISQNK